MRAKRLILILSLISANVFAVDIKEEIIIASASNFSAAMKDMANQFEKETGHKVKLVFGSSGKFYAQINHGAPFHAFFSADQDKPIALEKSGMIVPNSRFTYAIGRLALWSPIENLELDEKRLINNHYRNLAVANPKLAPYGKAAVEVLQHFDLIAKTQSKWVKGENVAQTFQFVSTGNVELGFIALSQIMINGRLAKGSAWIIPSQLHRAIRQDAVLLLEGKNSQATKDFLSYVTSENSKKFLNSYGYTSD